MFGIIFLINTVTNKNLVLDLVTDKNIISEYKFGIVFLIKSDRRYNHTQIQTFRI